MGILGGIIGGIGKKKAAKQKRADVQAAAAGLDPYADGTAAKGALEQAIGLESGPSADAEGLQRFRDSVGYRDMQNRALRGVAANAGARGLFGSTGTGERFQRTAGELADSTYKDYLAEDQRRIGNLFGLYKGAQSAATNRASLLAGQPASKGTLMQGIGSGLNKIFLG